MGLYEIRKLCLVSSPTFPFIHNRFRTAVP